MSWPKHRILGAEALGVHRSQDGVPGAGEPPAEHQGQQQREDAPTGPEHSCEDIPIDRPPVGAEAATRGRLPVDGLDIVGDDRRRIGVAVSAASEQQEGKRDQSGEEDPGERQDHAELPARGKGIAHPEALEEEGADVQLGAVVPHHPQEQHEADEHREDDARPK